MIVVTLTTIPERVGLLSDVLMSIERQTVLPDLTLLNVPLKSRTGRQFDQDKIGTLALRFGPTIGLIVQRVPIDEGPITKLLPALDRVVDQDAQLVVIDDDMIYPPDMIARLTNVSVKQIAAVGFAGRDYTLGFWDKTPPPEIKVAFLETFAGVRFLRSAFDSVLLRNFVQQSVASESSCLLTDDILLGTFLRQRSAQMQIISDGGVNAYSHPMASGTPRLMVSNIFLGKNRTCFRAIDEDARAGLLSYESVILIWVMVVLGVLACVYASTHTG